MPDRISPPNVQHAATQDTLVGGPVRPGPPPVSHPGPVDVYSPPQRLVCGEVANMFGLISDVLRTVWHGPALIHFARVCCDLAKLYGCLFQLYGMVEGLHVGIQWHRQELYRSRWGNYDLIPNPGLMTLSHELPIADVLASRLQGRQFGAAFGLTSGPWRTQIFGQLGKRRQAYQAQLLFGFYR